MDAFEKDITDPSLWKDEQGKAIPRETQVKILSELHSDFNSLSPQSKNEVIDTYASKVQFPTSISTGKMTPGVKDEIPNFYDEIPSIAGGIVGGLAGKTIPGRIVKSGVIGGGGEAAYQIYQHATSDPLAPKSTTEAGGRIAQAMASEATGQGLGEGLTRVGAKAIPKILPKYLESGLGEPGKELNQYMKPYEDRGGFLRNIVGLPAKEKATFTLGQQADQLSSVVKLESIIENSMFGGQPIKELKRVQEKAIQDYAQETVNKIWGEITALSPSEQGKALTDLFKENISNFHKTGNKLYDAIDIAVANKTFNTTRNITSPLLDATGKPIESTVVEQSDKWVNLKPLNQKIKTFVDAMKTRQGIGSSDAGDSFIKKASQLQDSMSFGEAQELKSGLLSEQRRLDKGEKASHVINELVSALDAQMEIAAKKISPDVFAAWKRADEFWKLGKEKYENDFIRGLLDTAIKNGQPELIGRQIFQNTEVGQIGIVKKALGFENGGWKNAEGKNAFQKIKAGWFEELMGKSTKINAGELEATPTGNALHEKLRMMAGKGKNWWEADSIKSMFTQQEINLIKNFETAARITQRKPASSGGSMLIQLIQAGSIMSVGYGVIGLIPGFENNKFTEESLSMGIAALAAPRILGKMLVNPKYQKLFIEGLNVNKPITWPILSKLLTGAVETQMELGRYNNMTPEKKPFQPVSSNKILPTQ